MKKAERLVVIQPGEEKILVRPWNTFQYLEGTFKRPGERFLTRACSDRTRQNDFRLKESRFTLDIMKKFSTLRVVRHWNRLSREAVDVPPLELSKARLDGALSNPV